MLKLISNVLFNAGETIEETVDWQEVFLESKNQTVCSLAFEATKQITLPPDVFEKWFSFAVNYLRNNIHINQNHTIIHNFLSDNGISYCTLKGCASEYYYPCPQLRTMGDVDFLLSDENFDDAMQKFIEAGYEITNFEHEFHRGVVKDGIDCEAHFAVSGIPDGKAGEIIKDYLKDIFEKSEETEIDKNVFMKPSHFHHGLIILLHTYSHLLFEGMGLRHLCDWAVFANSFSNEEFTLMFEEKLKRVGLWHFARVLSAVCVRFLKMPYKNWIGNVDNSLCDNIIADIFESGNFGGKNKHERAWQSQMISDRGTFSIGKSKFLKLIIVKNRDASIKFPIFKKCKILYPFGWIFLGLRYAIDLILGKRKYTNIVKLANEAEERREIYKHLHLYETEE
ncbi:MAG: nucleotidyltransferase family protein [Acutalibacteraceae bacterium]|nr:nucleotidyltransferase family protein [Acutalibacteraceae bacterium]